MKCPRCNGWLYPDDEGVPTCINCARKVMTVVPLDIPQEVKGQRRPSIKGVRI